MSLDLDAIKARVDAATAGAWSADPTGTICADVDLVPDGQGGQLLPPEGPMEVAECYRETRRGERAANAAFIAAARTDVPALVAEVETLRRLLAAMVDPGDILPDPCIPDVRGRGCHAHGFLDLKPGEQCPVGEARELLGDVA